jgi:hypothetical protein
MDLHTLARAHQLVEEGVAHLTEAPLDTNALLEVRHQLQCKLGPFQKDGNAVRHGPIGLQRLLFRPVYGDCRSAKKTEERDGRYLPQ